jgi:hypothetical protein
VPDDPNLRVLSLLFMDAVDEHEMIRAKSLVRRIEERTAQILAELDTHENAIPIGTPG